MTTWIILYNMAKALREGDVFVCGDVQKSNVPPTVIIDNKSAIVLGDLTAGAGLVSIPVPVTVVSQTVFVDGKGMATLLSAHETHAHILPPIPTHPLVIVDTDATVFVDEGPSTVVIEDTLEGEVMFDQVPALFVQPPTDFVKNKISDAASVPVFDPVTIPYPGGVPSNPNKQRSSASENVSENEQKYAPHVAATEAKYDIPTGLLHRLINAESSWRTSVIIGETSSRTGAKGIAQFMPIAIQELKNRGYIFDPLDPIASIEAAGKLLLRNIELLKSKGVPTNWDFVVASYNTGAGNVSKAYTKATNTGNPDNWIHYVADETKNYVKKIII